MSLTSSGKEKRTQFIMDFSMHKVAKYFRLLGYDTVCSKAIPHSALVSLAATSSRVLLTCSRHLVQQVEGHNRRLQRERCGSKVRRVVAYDSDGESIYSSEDSEEEGEIVCYFVEQWRSHQFNSVMINLIQRTGIVFDPTRVFSLCVTCNRVLLPVAKANVEGRVEPKIYEMYHEFTECRECKRVFWGFDGETVVNYKSFRTLELLKSLCRAADAVPPSGDVRLGSLKCFRSFPRSVKINILSGLEVKDLKTFETVFPVLKELIHEVIRSTKQASL